MTVDEVKRAIEQLPRNDRAMLRPWILARFDVRGYEVDDPKWAPDPWDGAPSTSHHDRS